MFAMNVKEVLQLVLALKATLKYIQMKHPFHAINVKILSNIAMH